MSRLGPLLEYLTEERWVNHSPAPCEGKECLATAIGTVFMDEDLYPYNTAVERAAVELFPERSNRGRLGSNYVYFNDHPQTTYADVVQVMQRAEELMG